MGQRTKRLDGVTRAVRQPDLVPGAVLRMVQSDGTVAPFSDCVIASVDGLQVVIVRPHASGSEEVAVSVPRILSPGSLFRTVLDSADNVYVAQRG